MTVGVLKIFCVSCKKKFSASHRGSDLSHALGHGGGELNGNAYGRVQPIGLSSHLRPARERGNVASLQDYCYQWNAEDEYENQKPSESEDYQQITEAVFRRFVLVVLQYA